MTSTTSPAKPHSGLVERRRKADPTVRRDPPAGDRQLLGGVGPSILEVEGRGLGLSEPEPLVGRDRPDALVGPLVVVVLDPHDEVRLGVSDRREDSAGDELLAQRPVESLEPAR